MYKLLMLGLLAGIGVSSYKMMKNKKKENTSLSSEQPQAAN